MLENLKMFLSPRLACEELKTEESKAGCQELGLHFSILSEKEKGGFLRSKGLAFIPFVHKNDHNILAVRKQGSYLRYQ